MNFSPDLQTMSASPHLPSLAAADDAPQTVEYLVFRVGAQEYAVDLQDVQEIRSYERATRLVAYAPCVLGVINLRGEIVPVLDLRTIMGVPSRFDELTLTVVLNLPSGTVGIVVDAVSDVIELAPSQVQAIPKLDDGGIPRLLAGLGTVGSGQDQRLVVLLHSDRLPEQVAASRISHTTTGGAAAL